MTLKSKYSQSFEQCLKLLLELHQLELDGLFESEMADRVRDQMDGPWYRMTRDETDLIRGLSADLNSLLADWPFPQPEQDAKEYSNEFYDYFQQRDWLRALDFLRKNSSDITLVNLNLLRSLCWINMGFPEAAWHFMAYNLQHGFSDIQHLKIYLLVCEQTRKFNEALNVLHSNLLLNHPLRKSFEFTVRSKLLVENSVSAIEAEKFREINRMGEEAVREIENTKAGYSFTRNEDWEYHTEWITTMLTLARNYLLLDEPILAEQKCQRILSSFPNLLPAAQLLISAEERKRSTLNTKDDPTLYEQLKKSRSLLMQGFENNTGIFMSSVFHNN